MSRMLRVLLTLSLLMVLAASPVRADSDYWSTLNYSAHLNGLVRSYTGSNVSIEYFSASVPSGQSGTQTLKLYRQVCGIWCENTLMGTKTGPYNGWVTKTWAGVGSGNYWFSFDKPQDYVNIQSNNVHMYSRN